jgi:GT2 family glycosyltransferase
VIRPERNLGFGGGCNAGVRHARAATLAFVNPDVQFAPGWIQPLVDALATRDAAIAAPVLLEPDRRVQSAGHQLLADGFTTPIRSSPGRGGVGRPDYASAACWLVRRAVFEELGGFDESFFPAYYEDVDLALRARPRGGTVVVGDSMVVHRRGASTAATEVPDTTAQRLRLLEKWPALATRPGTGRS